MLRTLIVLLILFATTTIHACSCVPGYTTLADAICQLDTLGGTVAEIRLVRRLGGNAAEFVVERHLLGPELDERIILESRSSCLLNVEQYNVGQLMLYNGYANGSSRREGRIDVFAACGYRSIYRISNDRRLIEYMQRDPNQPDRNIGLGFQTYRPSDVEAACDVKESLGGHPDIPPNPLKSINALNNPGDGMVSLVRTGEEPVQLNRVAVVNISGQVMRDWSGQDYFTEVSTPDLDIKDLPAGLYFLWLFGENRHYALRYVKTSR